MHRMLAAPYLKLLAFYLIVSVIALSAMSSSADAMFLPAAPVPVSSRSMDLAVIQQSLESRIIEQRLVDYGLSPEKAMAKIRLLPGEQVHRLASQIGALEAGGQMRGGGHVRGRMGGYGYVYGPLELTLIIVLIVLLIVVIAQDDTLKTS